ncbi:hypothetical protein PPHE_a3371 [Pseudoalteromonas phenolica O-BC30]|nr:hypothetical protein [Pseudoalteromonas phenolica O-BC30]
MMPNRVQFISFSELINQLITNTIRNTLDKVPVNIDIASALFVAMNTQTVIQKKKITNIAWHVCQNGLSLRLINKCHTMPNIEAKASIFGILKL